MAHRRHTHGADGTRLSVIVRDGDPTRPLFLLVHGLASNAHLWDGVGDRLADCGVRSIAVDQRGHGHSDRPDDGFDFPTLVDDLTRILAEHGGGQVVAVGQSWGGNVVLELAARQPDLVDAVGLVDGGFLRLRSEFPDLDTMLGALAPPVFDGLTRSQVEAGLRARYAHWPDTGVDGHLANFEDLDDGTVRARLSRSAHLTILRHLWEHDPDEVVGGLDRPVLVIGARDGATRKETRVAEFAAASEVVTVEWYDGHHDIHAEQPDLVAGRLLALVEGPP